MMLSVSVGDSSTVHDFKICRYNTHLCNLTCNISEVIEGFIWSVFYFHKTVKKSQIHIIIKAKYPVREVRFQAHMLGKGVTSL